MMPNHTNLQPQDSESPFVVTAKSEPGGSIQVSIESASGQDVFRGFLLRAFNTEGSAIDGGSYTTSEESKVLNCGDGSGSALTHNSRDEKPKIMTTWVPPSDFSGRVVFRATVVEKFDTFWVALQSESVPIASTRTSTQHLTTTPHPLNVYSQCGSSKGCFGLPSNCVEKEGCEIILTFRTMNDTIRFELTGALGTRSGWVAMALSKDSKMGQDSVTECVYLRGSVSAFEVRSQIIVRESWNTERPTKNNVLLPEEAKTIYDEGAEYEDGIITCRWSRPIHTVTNGKIFDLRNDGIHILLAKGPIDSTGNKIIHNAELASAYPVNLTSILLVVGKTSILLKIHGSFMTAAWIWLVSIGILLARHYKEVWMKYKLCNTKVWFSVHRCFMLLGVSLITVGFVAIFIHVDGWSNVGSNPHPIIGCVVTGLAVLQPITAICRPQPTSPKRPIFNWGHKMIGNIAQITAIVNMFFAVSLKPSNLPQAFYWVLVTFLIFHCLVHLLIHIHSCFMERERERESSAKLDQFQYGDGYDINEDAPGSSFKKFALGLYSFVNTGLTAALILMICLN